MATHSFDPEAPSRCNSARARRPVDRVIPAYPRYVAVPSGTPSASLEFRWFTRTTFSLRDVDSLMQRLRLISSSIFEAIRAIKWLF